MPPNAWFHQHFNSGPMPARYLAFKHSSPRNSQGVPMSWISRRLGGNQIDYADEKPLVRQLFADALAKHGLDAAHGRGLRGRAAEPAAARWPEAANEAGASRRPNAGLHGTAPSATDAMHPSVRACRCWRSCSRSARPAQAQTIAELAAYSGADRTQRLIDGAKKEGALTIYSSMTVADMGALINAFQAKYGVKAQHWRGSSEDIRNRVAREYAAGRYDADVAETAGPDMEAMVREQLLQKVATPVSKELIPQATFAHGQWIATRLIGLRRRLQHQHHQARRTRRRPTRTCSIRSFKGKLGIEAEDANWFMSVVLSHGRGEGPQAVPATSSPRNGMSIRKGHTLLANLVPTGEVPLALTAYSYRVEQLKNEGAPVEIVYLPPVGRASRPASACSGSAPHPHAALLFEDFILTDGQKILAEREAVPTNPEGEGCARRLDLRRSSALPRRGRQVDEAVPGDVHGRARSMARSNGPSDDHAWIDDNQAEKSGATAARRSSIRIVKARPRLFISIAIGVVVAVVLAVIDAMAARLRAAGRLGRLRRALSRPCLPR